MAAEMAQVAVGICLLLAAIAKVRSIGRFESAVGSFGLLPKALVRPVGWSVVLSEFVIGGCLAAGFRVEQAGVAALSLVTLFGAAMAVAWLRGTRVADCMCLGAGGVESMSIGGVLRLVLLGAGAFVAVSAPGGSGWPSPSVLLGAAVVVLASAWLVRLPDLVSEATTVLRTRTKKGNSRQVVVR